MSKTKKIVSDNSRQWVIVIALAMLTQLICKAQINTDQVMRVGQNAMYFEDYVLSIQYFNQAIQSKPYLAQPYFYRAVAKFNLEDFAGAEDDASKALELNPFLADAWEVRGVARQNLGKNDLAISDYDEALIALPHNRQIMFNRAMAIGALKDYERADSAFSELISYYPGFDNAYLGRAMVKLELNDTIAASADIDKALQINPNAFNGHLMRSEIALKHDDDPQKAIESIDQAIKLEPKLTNLYINRAYLRYTVDDYFGAMADYSYALQLEPDNQAALFNRALLRTEVNDIDNALSDYNKILEIDPENDMALYNRSIIFAEKGDYQNAIADISKVIEIYPTLGAPYFMRSEWLLALGETRRAKADNEKAEALTDANRPISRVTTRHNAFAIAEDQPQTVTEELSPEQVSERFKKLITVENNTHFEEEYNNSSIRGKVQDRRLNVEIEPMMEISYYPAYSELKQRAYYIKEVDDLNASRTLRQQVYVSNKSNNMLDEDAIKQHFSSIEYFNSYISTHKPRAVDYIGRAIDLITVKNYPAALSDLDKAVDLAPEYALAYMLRAQARYHNTEEPSRKVALSLALADIDKAIELSPRNPLLWFNKGNILYEMGDNTSAIAAYTKAIEMQPDMGEAYYNRGYIYLSLGSQDLGVSDLSKAGELGIVAAYNVLKRLSIRP